MDALKDYARAAVDCMAASVDEQIKAGLERVTQALKDKGHVDAHPRVSVGFRHYLGGYRYYGWLGTSPDPDIPTASTFAEVIDNMVVAVAGLPPRWSDADVAATLGIGRAA